VESPDVLPMQTNATSSAEGVGIMLATGLLAACSVNLLLIYAWL
jgi:hypothetical protein